MEGTLLLGGLAVGSKEPDHVPSTFPVPTPDVGSVAGISFPLNFFPLVFRAFRPQEGTAHDSCHRKVSFSGVS